jgi:beta-phosphoglucomutase-like phosphatase (HAD superfamily)
VAEALMIGDSANDAEAARAAGMPVLLVTYGYSEGVPVDSIECDGLLSSLVDALRASAADPDRRPSIVTRKRMPFVEEFPAVRIPSGGCGGRSWLGC